MIGIEFRAANIFVVLFMLTKTGTDLFFQYIFLLSILKNFLEITWKNKSVPVLFMVR